MHLIVFARWSLWVTTLCRYTNMFSIIIIIIIVIIIIIINV